MRYAQTPWSCGEGTASRGELKHFARFGPERHIVVRERRAFNVNGRFGFDRPRFYDCNPPVSAISLACSCARFANTGRFGYTADKGAKWLVFRPRRCLHASRSAYFDKHGCDGHPASDAANRMEFLISSGPHIIGI